MAQHIIRADILLIARIFLRPFGARKNTTQLAKYPPVLYVRPSNKMYISYCLSRISYKYLQMHDAYSLEQSLIQLVGKLHSSTVKTLFLFSGS